MVVLDTETTGLSSETDVIIELGMVKVMYSKSLNRISSIIEVVSLYEDPLRPIPPLITQLTGITDDMVAGQKIDDAWVKAWQGNKPLFVAHNAKFDLIALHQAGFELNPLTFDTMVAEWVINPTSRSLGLKAQVNTRLGVEMT